MSALFLVLGITYLILAGVGASMIATGHRDGGHIVTTGLLAATAFALFYALMVL